MAKKNYESKTDDYMTPPSLYNPILNFAKIERFTCDVSCSGNDIPAKFHYTKKGIFCESKMIFQNDDGLKGSWVGTCFMNPPWSKCPAWLRKAISEVIQNDCEVWCVLPADRMNMIFFNEFLRNHSNWFMAIPEHSKKQSFNFHNPHATAEENQQNIKNGGFKKPFMILYIGKNSEEYAARWKAEQPLISVVLR